MAEVTLTATANGPYLVEGPFELIDPEGNPIPAPEGRIVLCRCGRSADKPFCDSSTCDTPPACTRQHGNVAI